MNDKLSKCSNCNGIIHYGESIIVDPINDKVYCGIDCFLDSHDCYILDSHDDYNEYDSWFNDNDLNKVN